MERAIARIQARIQAEARVAATGHAGSDSEEGGAGAGGTGAADDDDGDDNDDADKDDDDDKVRTLQPSARSDLNGCADALQGCARLNAPYTPFWRCSLAHTQLTPYPCPAST